MVDLNGLQYRYDNRDLDLFGLTSAEAHAFVALGEAEQQAALQREPRYARAQDLLDREADRLRQLSDSVNRFLGRQTDSVSRLVGRPGEAVERLVDRQGDVLEKALGELRTNVVGTVRAARVEIPVWRDLAQRLFTDSPFPTSEPAFVAPATGPDEACGEDDNIEDGTYYTIELVTGTLVEIIGHRVDILDGELHIVNTDHDRIVFTAPLTEVNTVNTDS